MHPRNYELILSCEEHAALVALGEFRSRGARSWACVLLSGMSPTGARVNGDPVFMVNGDRLASARTLAVHPSFVAQRGFVWYSEVPLPLRSKLSALFRRVTVDRGLREDFSEEVRHALR